MVISQQVASAIETGRCPYYFIILYICPLDLRGEDKDVCLPLAKIRDVALVFFYGKINLSKDIAGL